MLFWLEGSDTPQALEYAQIRGEMLALEHTAIVKECEEAIVLAAKWRAQEQQEQLQFGEEE